MKAPPTLETLYAAFPNGPDEPDFVDISPNEMPEPYRQLLVHTHHMTVTVEGFYGQAVNVQVLDRVQVDHYYCRKILLTLKETGEVVQFGIVRIDLDCLANEVREEIVAEQTPLGRVLIQNGVLREIHPKQFYRVTPDATVCGWFQLKEPTVCYARMGVITTDSKPAIEVLEILAPILPSMKPSC